MFLFLFEKSPVFENYHSKAGEKLFEQYVKYVENAESGPLSLGISNLRVYGLNVEIGFPFYNSEDAQFYNDLKALDEIIYKIYYNISS